jgi:hypothetical protein
MLMDDCMNFRFNVLHEGLTAEYNFSAPMVLLDYYFLEDGSMYVRSVSLFPLYLGVVDCLKKGFKGSN